MTPCRTLARHTSTPLARRCRRWQSAVQARRRREQRSAEEVLGDEAVVVSAEVSVAGTRGRGRRERALLPLLLQLLRATPTPLPPRLYLQVNQPLSVYDNEFLLSTNLGK